MTLETLLAGAKRIGFSAVEIWQRDKAPFSELVELAPKHGLRIASMSGHYKLEDGLNNPANHPRIADELAVSIELAAKHNIPGLICFSGNRNGRSDEESVEVCAAGLRRVTKLAEEKGINLNVELLNSKRTHPGYQCDHTAWGVRVCEAAGSPRAKLLYDIYHMQIMEGDLIETIRKNIKYIGHFHTAGVPGRGPLDETQEIYYPAVCRAIAEAGYDLYLGHEFGSKGDPLEALAKAFKACDAEGGTRLDPAIDGEKDLDKARKESEPGKGSKPGRKK
jgi:hydroxypyruvate isomerase